MISARAWLLASSVMPIHALLGANGTGKSTALSQFLEFAARTDSRPGASNKLGTDVLAHLPPDGYTIGIVGGSHKINKYRFKNLGWDPEKNFEPIVYTHGVPLVFAIYPQIPAKTLAELVAWMKAHPADAKVPTSGIKSDLDKWGKVVKQAGIQPD